MAAVGRALSPVCVFILWGKNSIYINYKNVDTRTRMKNLNKYEQKVGMPLQKRADTRGVGISNMRKSIHILPYNHTY